MARSKIDFRAIPPAVRGLRIGLFGGSFDPAHEGHAHVAETAKARLGLDQVWWLVTPQNPLKTHRSSPFKERMASARRMARGATMVVTDLETRLGLQFTADTLAILRKRRPGVRFVWLMGSDALERFHLWRCWREIFAAAPIAVIARPGAGFRARNAPAFRLHAEDRVPAADARTLASAEPPAWIYLNARHHAVSSSAIRCAAAAR
jgi:nicotinate-nucleotide adenylyltransferase